MAIQVKGQKVYLPLGSDISVSAVRATSTSLARVPAVTAAPVVVQAFHHMEEILHDGGSIGTTHTTDLLFNAMCFRAVLTSSESAYVALHHSFFVYYCVPLDLTMDVRTPIHASIEDPNWRTSIANLVSAYGIDNIYMLMGNEWDQDPPNLLWARNRWLEAGSTSTPNHPTTGMSRQTIVNQFYHFYLDNNHGGNTNHHQLGQILNVPYTTRGYKTMTMNVYPGLVHFAYDMGVDLVILEINNDDVPGYIGAIGLIRGSAIQYGRKWGTDLSQSRTYGPRAGVTAYNSSGVLVSGWTNSTFKRTFYLAYFAGSDCILLEGANLSANGTVNINGRLYIPLCTEIRNFNDFAINRHTTRGIPHVPVAVMQDHLVDWEPNYGQFNQSRRLWYNVIPCNEGEKMMHNLWDLIYPNYSLWGSSTSTTEPWGSGRWGEQFDVVTERISASAMGYYRAIILAGNTVMDSTLQAKLATYAANGGTVIISAKQLSGTAHSTLTGITTTGTASTSGTLTWELDNSTTTEPTFNYTTVTLGTATRIARTGASTPQVTQNLIGAGKVWTILPDWGSNAANTATLGVTSKIIDVLVSVNAVAWITGGNHTSIDYCITKNGGTSGNARIVCIVNTSNTSTAWTGTVNVPGTGTPVREWVTDTTPSFTTIGGNTQVSAAVAAGDVRVYAVG